MAVKVVTVSTCDRCGRVKETEGNEPGVPAFTWVRLKLEARLPNDDCWEAHPDTLVLCWACIGAFNTFMNPPKDAPGPQGPA